MGQKKVKFKKFSYHVLVVNQKLTTEKIRPFEGGFFVLEKAVDIYHNKSNGISG